MNKLRELACKKYWILYFLPSPLCSQEQKDENKYVNLAYRKKNGLKSIAPSIRGINPEQLMLGFIDFVNKVRENKGKPLIAIDGKTLRGSFTEERSSALDMVSVFAVKQGLTLCQQRSTGKKNEINTTESLLDLFDIKGAVITADAMNTQRKIADKIVTLGGDYILQVKDNQKGLLDEIKAYIHKVRRD